MRGRQLERGCRKLRGVVLLEERQRRSRLPEGWNLPFLQCEKVDGIVEVRMGQSR